MQQINSIANNSSHDLREYRHSVNRCRLLLRYDLWSFYRDRRRNHIRFLLRSYAISRNHNRLWLVELLLLDRIYNHGVTLVSNDGNSVTVG